jgi:ABC-2 type transport system ATP-binding protein
VRHKIGYMPENVPLYHDMTVDEYLRFVGRARGLDGPSLSSRLDWCTEACGLVSVFKRKIQELSKGYRQRTGLAQALIHDPDILILDEPTSGLDPFQIIGIRELIKSLAGHKTIIFSTHILQEVGPVTDRVVIINQGSVVADGQISELTNRAMGTNRIYVGVRGESAQIQPALAGLPYVTELRPLADAPAGTCRFELRGAFQDDLVGAIASAARERGWPLLELHESRYTLEDTFIALTRKSRGHRKQEVA